MAEHNWTITLIRHATIVVAVGGERIVVDPMLDLAGAREPIANSPQPRRNPLVELPANAGDHLTGPTAAIVTHLHADHLDEEGVRFLAREQPPTLGQAEDLESLRARGLTQVLEIGAGPVGELKVYRTGGEHGVGAIGASLGPVSGVVLERGDERVYIAGDTVPCPAVGEAMRRHRPTTVVLNAGGARFLEGEPITMAARDVVAFAAQHPSVTVVAIHMDAINHCVDTRAVLRDAISQTGVSNVHVPEDGASVALPGR